jgi:hypothetical protein
VKAGVCTEKSARTGLEKRVRSAVVKNKMNMLVYSSIIQDRRREGREGGHERMPRKPRRV